MNSRFAVVWKLMLAMFMVVAMNACAKKAVPVKQELPPPAGYGAEQGTGAGGGVGLGDSQWQELGLNTPAERQQFLSRANKFENEDIYFAYDAYVLSEEARRVLDKKIEFLRSYPKVRVTIEGHCDERGTSEYNLALGERRATSAYQYLVNSGIAADHLTMVSYGKERPIDSGHTEEAWAKNRRAHFVLNF